MEINSEAIIHYSVSYMLDEYKANPEQVIQYVALYGVENVVFVGYANYIGLNVERDKSFIDKEWKELRKGNFFDYMYIATETLRLFLREIK